MGGLGLGLSLEGSAQFKINHKMVLNDEDGTYGRSFFYVQAVPRFFSASLTFDISQIF